MPCPCQLWGGLESPENLLVPSSQEAATAGPPALRSPCSPSPAPAPAVLLPSKVPWEGGTGPVTKGGRMGRRGSLLTPVSIMIPHHLRGGGSLTQEQGSLKEVRVQLIQNQGDFMGGLG